MLRYLTRCINPLGFRFHKTNGVVLLGTVKVDWSQLAAQNYIHSQVATNARLSSAMTASLQSQVSNTNKSTYNRYPLTKHEAFTFISDSLRISNIHDALKEDKLATLNDIIQRLRKFAPMTNMLIITDRTDYDANLFFEKMKRDLMARYGGQCIWFSAFLHALLGHLGYHVSFVGGPERRFTGIYNVHCAILAHNVTHPGSKHLVEASHTYEIFHAVPLDFSEETVVYNFGENKRKFVNAGNGAIKYCQLLKTGESPRTHLSEVFKQDGQLWEVVIEYKTANDLPLSSFVDIAVLLCYRIRTICTFYQTNLRVIGFSDDKWVYIHNTSVSLRDPEGKLVKTFELSTLHETINIVTKYFPEYTSSVVEDCINTIIRNRTLM